jgi:Effector-associated domain 1
MESNSNLPGPVVKRLQEALLAAFPTRSALAQMARVGLDENLDAIAATENLSVAIFELIRWAEAQGQLDKLIAAARRANPGNLMLRALAKDLGMQGQVNPSDNHFGRGADNSSGGTPEDSTVDHATTSPELTPATDAPPIRSKLDAGTTTDGRPWADDLEPTAISGAESPRARDWLAPCIVVLALFAAIGWSLGGATHDDVLARATLMRNSADYAQVAVILFVICRGFLEQAKPWPIRPEGWAKRELDACHGRIKQWVKTWRLLWLGWGALYAHHAMEHAAESFLGNERVRRWEWPLAALDTGIDNFNNVLLFFMFWVLSRPTYSDDKGRRREWRSLLAMAGAVYAGAALQYQLGIAAADSRESIGLWTDLVSGVFATVCFGLLLSRLGSGFLSVHPLELAALYLYAAIQTAFPVAGLNRLTPIPDPNVYLVGLVLKLLTLALKIGMYVVVQRQITTGRLAFYMYAARRRHKEMPGEWELFRQTRLAPEWDRGAYAGAP